MRITRIIPLAALALSATVASAQKPTHPKHTKLPKKVETPAEMQNEAKVTMDDARATALKEVPGATIQSGEIEREGGKLIYSFDMKVPGKDYTDEINIDAMTGKLVSHERETPADESAEAKADSEAEKPTKAKAAKTKAAKAKAAKAKAAKAKAAKAKP